MSEENEKDMGQDPGDGVTIITEVCDWILRDVTEDPFYNFEWWSDYAKSKMKPLVKRSSLGKEMMMKASEIAMASFYFGNEPIEQKKRIKYIVAKSMDDGIDEGYEKASFSMDDIRGFTEKEFARLYNQSRKRLFKLIDSLEELGDDSGDEYYIERTVLRNQAFEAAYLCLRTDMPEETFYLLWGLIDLYWNALVSEKKE